MRDSFAGESPSQSLPKHGIDDRKTDHEGSTILSFEGGSKGIRRNDRANQVDDPPDTRPAAAVPSSPRATVPSSKMPGEPM